MSAVPVEQLDPLQAYATATAACTRCRLAEGRTQVVFGAGNPHADLMFVGEAPGFHEDKQGVPFVGQAGKLLDGLLAGVGLERDDVYIANVLKCLRYTAAVQLGDGSWERIGRLVRERYSGTVMAVDDQHRLVPRQVTGWHETPLGGRRVFKLTYRSAKNAGATRSGIQLTGDHPVLTRRGYIPVQELRMDDEIATGQGMSRLALDVVIGSLLGDGSINRSSSHFQLAHSLQQEDYARFKAALLTELRPHVAEAAVAAVVGGEKTHSVVHLRTRAHRSLRTLRHQFYTPTKRVPGWLGHELSPRMLTIWFLDDGYTRIRPGRSPLAEIATNGFPQEDLYVLRHGLLRLGLPSSIRRGRIYFDVHATRKLCELIAPYVPESMRYKLDPEVAVRIPFDPALWERGERTVLYDRVEVEDVTDRERADVTFFCLDVEETHNFVTAGGVVHNCRPPGNRDPQADEIESCEPHLFRQIELIEPKVIATLGNFATKLLSGRPLGITRVHGQEQELTIAGRSVVLYPLYHPAAALYTPAMLKVLEADFARLPALLGGGPALTAVPAEEPASNSLLQALSAPAEQLGLF
ncbi:MAG TPA: uracil-DNA glycosylase family protein [Gaiellaceae bacterium]|nr:uracil-DNA glycosylase family protein [Gaiellaceae bacterium]